jgi:uncharacterized membrane-anchored protein
MRQHDFGLENHPLRPSFSGEMHVRKLPPLEAPARLMQVVLVSPAETVPVERARLADLCGLEPAALEGLTHFVGGCGGLTVVWERHTEFSSLMFIRPGGFDEPFALEAFDALPERWFERLPGKVVRATQLAFSDAEPGDQLAGWFAEPDLVVCDVADGAARLYSDFRLHPDGFGRLLVVDHGLAGPEAALVIQRLQELGNYRNLALMALPLAQALTPEVSRYEARLAELSAAIAAGELSDADLLAELSSLSASLAEMAAQTRYRMSATRAYGQISHDRLDSLRIGRVQGYPTLADFTDRRLLPAIRTCISFSARLEDLSQRLAWTSALLRTRVDTALSTQHRDLLASMDRRTRLQLRLQETVESLSVVAISYYALGLIGYALKAAPRLGLDHDLAMAVAAPFVVLCAWLAMRRIRRGLSREAARPESR